MRALIVLLACAPLLALTGCRTHTITSCEPTCDDIDRARFVDCVANGTAHCAAGSRRCCATMEVHCVGTLEDQEVVTSATCEQVQDDACWPPCDDMSQILYDGCVDAGSATCGAGDVDCCALSVDCLGDLGDVVVTADGCCSDELDCALDEVCDTQTWECVPDVTGPGCGDEVVQPPEQCDDGNDVTEPCPYGVPACEVCAAGCMLQAGMTSFCGDGRVDEAAGEECEPPASSACDPSCRFPLAGPCTNGMLDPNETDVDCGGVCPPCLPGDHCGMDLDCRAVPSMCPGLAFCDVEILQCVETEPCDDGDFCTRDTCSATGCVSAPIDDDMDGFGPRALGCGEDCDDTNRAISPAVMVDGCGNGDEDCDDLVDEDC